MKLDTTYLFQQQTGETKDYRFVAYSGNYVPVSPFYFQADNSSEAKQVNKIRFDVPSMDMTRYQANPIVLWMHDTTIPLGNAQVTKSDKALFASVTFDEVGFSGVVKKKVDAGTVRAVSMAVRPTEQSKIVYDGDGQVTVQGAEFIELSLVTLPRDPAALRFNFSNDFTAVLSQDALSTLQTLGKAEAQEAASTTTEAPAPGPAPAEAAAPPQQELAETLADLEQVTGDVRKRIEDAYDEGLAAGLAKGKEQFAAQFADEIASLKAKLALAESKLEVETTSMRNKLKEKDSQIQDVTTRLQQSLSRIRSLSKGLTVLESDDTDEKTFSCFEDVLNSLQAGGMSYESALRQAMKDHPNLHREYVLKSNKKVK